MNLTHVSDNLSIVNDVCLTSRMKEVLSCIWIIGFFLMKSDFFKELFYNTFHTEEVSISVHSKCKLHSFVRQFCQWKCLWKVNISKLVQTNILVSSVVVCCKRCQHTIQGCCTHDTVIFSKRVHDLDCLTHRIILVEEELVKYLRAFK